MSKGLFFTLFLFLFLNVKAQSGALDLNFNSGAGANDIIRAIAIQQDGKIIIGGDFTTYNGVAVNHIVRLNSNGSIDTSFQIGLGFNARVHSIQIQPDNKILVAGSYTSYNGQNCARLSRLNIDGSLDNSFNIGTGFTFTVKDIQLQTDGKILAGGSFTRINGLFYSNLVRLNNDGSIDTTFNTLNALNGSVETIAIQPDGKIVFGGSFTSFFGVQGYRVARANTNGSVDSTFNPGIGGAGSNVEAIVLLPDGRMMIGGQFTFYNGSTLGHIVRTKTDGTIDFTYLQNPGSNLPILALSMIDDSSFFAGGSFTTYQGISSPRIAKITGEGYLDTLFNTGSGASGDVLAISLHNNNKIIIAGDFATYNGITANHIARLYNCNTPQPDSIFGLSFAECSGTAQTYYTNPVAGATQYEWTLPNGWTGSSDSASITAISDGNGGTISVKAYTDACGYSNATSFAINTNAPPGVDICLITVDTTSTHNIIVWEKPTTTLIDSFCIYRETSTNVYTKIASLPYSAFSEYHDLDTNANPNITSFRYKLSVKDTCGAESALSPYHNTIHLQYLANGNFQWTFYQIEGQPNPVVSFNFNRDAFADGNFFAIGNIPGTNATFTDITYASFPSADYVVDVNWDISCSPSRNVNTTRSNIKKGQLIFLNNQVLEIENIKLYPNPASEILHISAENMPEKNIYLELYNALGNRVLQDTITSNKGIVSKDIDIQPLAKGIYFLHLQTSDGFSIQKRVVVQ